MIAEVNAVRFRQQLGQMLAHVHYGHDSIVVTKDGERVAAVIDTVLFDQIRALKSRFDELCDQVATGYTEIEEAEGMAEIDAVATQVRHSH